MSDWIGWTASVLLFVTMASQVRKQWVSEAVAGVSQWLFIGQLGASVLFILYSALKKDHVFVVVNSVMVANALLGLWVDRRNRARQSTRSDELGLP